MGISRDETVNKMHVALESLFEEFDQDLNRDGLRDTPKRVVNAFREMLSGYDQSPGEILERRFVCEYDEIIVLKDIAFTSLCEHHLLPFMGEVSIAYLPGLNNKVVGLSKLARLVDCFSKRLQIQERMTVDIADAMERHLQPLGTAVVVRAHHSCMSCRGVRKPGSVMITSKMNGVFRNEDSARAEVLKLIG
jgi:GTP cyclohydrolase I